MAFNFVLPDLGEGIAEGEIRKWLVKEGDAIEEHQAVLEIETDKAVAEVPSPKSGTVLKISKEEGDTVKVGEVLIVIGEPGEKPGEKTGAKPVEKPKPEEPRKSVSVVGELPEEEEEVKPAAARPKSVSVVGELPEHEEAAVLAVPAVRAFAKEQGVSLEKIKGTGPGGSISRDDVLKTAKLPAKDQDRHGPFERVAIKGLRKTIARNLRAREKRALEEKGVHLTFMPFIMKAIQHALMDFATFNASVDEDREEIIVKKYFNIGVAVDTAEGLIVTVVKNVEKKTIRELAAELQNLSKQARERTIKLEDLRGSTFTVTNYGTYGSTFATPIINYPDVAILGTGKIADKPWVKDNKIMVRKILPLSLTFDHRVNDGAGAAKFLTKLVDYLEDPASIFIESA
jgi:pyruvate dehydrogenase E2 component (dihydrolipoamide acetyltransferase)